VTQLASCNRPGRGGGRPCPAATGAGGAARLKGRKPAHGQRRRPLPRSAGVLLAQVDIILGAVEPEPLSSARPPVQIVFELDGHLLGVTKHATFIVMTTIATLTPPAAAAAAPSASPQRSIALNRTRPVSVAATIEVGAFPGRNRHQSSNKHYLRFLVPLRSRLTALRLAQPPPSSPKTVSTTRTTVVTARMP
jgi:hypothetical protein